LGPFAANNSSVNEDIETNQEYVASYFLSPGSNEANKVILGEPVTNELLTRYSPFSYLQNGSNDLSDVLLLYDSANETASAINFRKISEYYGVKWADIDIGTLTLSLTDLKDESGTNYHAIFTDTSTLSLLDPTELALLEDIVNLEGTNLFIADVYVADTPGISVLTEGEVVGGQETIDDSKDFIFSDALPEVTREFSGQVLTDIDANPQFDYELILDTFNEHVIAIISATDNASNTYPIFVRYKNGQGSIFIQSRNRRIALVPGENYMEWLYLPEKLTEIVPMMMFVRYSIGDEVWHRDIDYANFATDDPALTCGETPPCAYGNLIWEDLLSEMEVNNFHTTIAFIPQNYLSTEAEISNIFLNHPDRYSLAIHGNNHDSGLPPPYDCPEFNLEVPLELQEADLLEAHQRMDQHQQNSGIPNANVMILPCRIDGQDTFRLLKKYNYNFTTNSPNPPVDAPINTAWDRKMYLAQMEYYNFPNVTRYSTTGDEYLTSFRYIFDLFRDESALLFSHHTYFENGMDAFNQHAEKINGLEGDVTWTSLDDIAKHLYLIKRNDDNSMDVMIFGNNIILENSSDSSQTYHVRRDEDFDFPFRVEVNGVDMPYSTTGNELHIVIIVPAHTTREIDIIYATISGSVFDDRDLDGQFSLGDVPLSEVEIRLSDGENIYTTFTYPDGSYQFANLLPGNYTLTEIDPLGYESSGDTYGDNDNAIDFGLPPAISINEMNFFDYRVCYSLTLGYIGNGTVPIASPTNSTGCSSGEYHFGEQIQLSGSIPDPGWVISGWTGTDNDSSTASTNSLSMPANTHQAEVNYTVDLSPPVLIAPTGTIEDLNPTFEWEPVIGATEYQFQVMQGPTEIYIQTVSSDACTATLCTNTPLTQLDYQTYNWRARAFTFGLWTDYSAWMSFTIESPPQVCYILTVTHTGQGSDPLFVPPYSAGCQPGEFIENENINLLGQPDSGWGVQSWVGTDDDTSKSTTNSLYMPPSSHQVTVNYGQLTFLDVPFDHPFYDYIMALWDAGLTAGCSTDPLMYCPDQILNRAMAAVFMLRGEFGTAYVPPNPQHIFTDDWTSLLPPDYYDVSWAEKWAEGMWAEEMTAGCLASPLMYCPRRELPRVEAAVFGLNMKFGVAYVPPAATGTVFADMTDTGYWGTKWAEQAYLEGLLPACGLDEGSGKPLFCPDDLVDRAWASYLIVQAKDLLSSP